MRTIPTLAVVTALLSVLGCGTSVEGDGDGTGGSSTSAGPGGSSGPLDCSAYARCATSLGTDYGRCHGGGSCAFVPGCVTAICIDDEEACGATCPDSACLIMESYPSQIGCEGDETEAVDEVTCEEVSAELQAIQSCTRDDECGLVLEGTSCGCTRDLVARLDATTAIFDALREAAGGCEFGSTCDCPETDGFACVDGVCAHRYVAP